MKKTTACLAALLTTLLVAPAAARAQKGFGPLDPAPPAGHSIDEIIQKFGEKETEFQHALDTYTFRQSVTMAAIDDDTNKVIGEYQQVTDIVFDPEGKRAEHVVFAPGDTLDNANIGLTQTDFDEVEHRLPFVLTTADQPLYDIKYLGRQKVDDLDTYVFEARPKHIEKGHHYFQGKIWVDQQDLEIAMVSGTTVPQDTRPGHEDLQPPFTTYYEQVDGKYWFPVYTKAEGVLHFPAYEDRLDMDVHVRNVVKYTDYKQFHATSRIIYDGQDITDQKAPDAQPLSGQTPPAKK
jgi:hypothetical protein